MFLSSEADLYFSSVVIFISVPSEMGMSASPVVLPVRISGPFFAFFSISRASSGTEKTVLYQGQWPRADQESYAQLLLHCQ